MVETVYSNGAYRLANLNGDTLMMPLMASSWRSTIPDHVNIILLMKKVPYMTTLTLNLWPLRQTINPYPWAESISSSLLLGFRYRMLTSKIWQRQNFQF